MFDVYVALLDTEDEDGWNYVFVCSVPKTTDMGEIVAALDVLFPQRIGCTIEPSKEDPDA